MRCAEVTVSVPTKLESCNCYYHPHTHCHDPPSNMSSTGCTGTILRPSVWHSATDTATYTREAYKIVRAFAFSAMVRSWRRLDINSEDYQGYERHGNVLIIYVEQGNSRKIKPIQLTNNPIRHRIQRLCSLTRCNSALEAIRCSSLKKHG